MITPSIVNRLHRNRMQKVSFSSDMYPFAHSEWYSSYSGYDEFCFNFGQNLFIYDSSIENTITFYSLIWLIAFSLTHIFVKFKSLEKSIIVTNDKAQLQLTETKNDLETSYLSIDEWLPS
jgi:hypothetical protein